MPAWVACHPRNLAHTESKAVTPIDPAAQKFHRLILCSLLDNSVTLAASSMPGLVLRKCHIADTNQHIAEMHPVISAAVSMSDLMLRLYSLPERTAILPGSGCDASACCSSQMTGKAAAQSAAMTQKPAAPKSA
jgi:hypothetical protein